MVQQVEEMIEVPLYLPTLKEFLERLKLKQRSQETIRGYEIDLRQFLESLKTASNGPVFVDQITSESIEMFIQMKIKESISPTSINRKIYAISSYCNYLVLKRYLPLNPCNEVERLKGKSKERVFLSADEVNQLIEKVEQSIIKYVVILMSFTGLRINEAINLQIKDVDLEKSVVQVINGKGGKNRTVPISDELKELLQHYLDRLRPKTESLNFFATAKTGSISQQYVNVQLKKAAKKAGIEKHITSHILRHSFASRLVQNNVHVAIIQRLLGHSDVRTTSVYMHVDQTEMLDAVNHINFSQVGESNAR